MPRKDTYVVILAGGAGARLGGVRKADLRVGGVPLLNRVAEALGQSSHPLLIATGPGAAASGSLSGDIIAIPDAHDQHAGPVAGLCAAVAWLEREGISNGLLLSVAVDTPFLPTDYADRLCTALESSAAAAAAWRGQVYPTNALWRLESLAKALPEASSPKRLLAALGAATVNWDTPVDPFANLNTLADLMALQGRGRRPY